MKDVFRDVEDPNFGTCGWRKSISDPGSSADVCSSHLDAIFDRKPLDVPEDTVRGKTTNCFNEVFKRCGSIVQEILLIDG